MIKIKNTKPKCYIYVRVSTEMQVDGYSLEAQKERLTKFADYQGWRLSESRLLCYWPFREALSEAPAVFRRSHQQYFAERFG